MFCPDKSYIRPFASQMLNAQTTKHLLDVLMAEGELLFGTALFYSCLIALFLFLLILSNSQHHLLQVGAFAREVVSPPKQR